MLLAHEHQLKVGLREDGGGRQESRIRLTRHIRQT